MKGERGERVEVADEILGWGAVVGLGDGHGGVGGWVVVGGHGLVGSVGGQLCRGVRGGGVDVTVVKVVGEVLGVPRVLTEALRECVTRVTVIREETQGLGRIGLRHDRRL